MRDLHAAISNLPPAEHVYDWDPIHMPGSVQAYGVLLVADSRTRRVLFASENAVEIFGVQPTAILDSSYLMLADHEAERAFISEHVKPDTILFPNPLRMTIKGKACDAVFHSHGNYHQIEIEPAGSQENNYDELAMAAAADLYDPPSVDELYQRAVRTIRQVSGFDRVMLYRFDPRSNGQVIAEAAREGVGSFLGLFFPSSDIGARARDMYLHNFTRYIPDIGAAPFSLRSIFPGNGRSDSAHPVDMSFTNLRSVVPCHITYLQNIGIKASMSFSINVDNRLWGLFACHHYEPKRVSYERRVVCEQTAMMFIYRLVSMSSTAARLARRQKAVETLGHELSIAAVLRRRVLGLADDWCGTSGDKTARSLVACAVQAVEAECGYLLSGQGGSEVVGEAALTSSQRLLLDLVEADSAAVVRHGRVRRIGDAPPEMAVYAIASMFGRELPDLLGGDLHIYATDCLSIHVPVADAIKDRAAGILAVALSLDSPAYLIWFRREQIQEVTWAGNPSADAMSAGADGLNPRASFEAWKQDIRGLSRAWVIEDVQVADELAVILRDLDLQGDGSGRTASDEMKRDAGQFAPPPTAVPHVMPLPNAAHRVIRIGHR